MSHLYFACDLSHALSGGLLSACLVMGKKRNSGHRTASSITHFPAGDSSLPAGSTTASVTIGTWHCVLS